MTTVNEPLLLAINDDPHLIVAFDDSVDLTAASRVRLELRWVWDSRYSAAIDSLSQELAKRNRALLHQWSTINTLKSENSYQETTLGELRKHVPVLMEYEQIQTHLRMALEQQMNKNDLLYEFLLARPTTRIKAFLSRMTSRLLRRPVHEVDTNLFKPPAPEPEPTPLEELLGQNTEDYDLWVSENDLTPDQLDAARIEIENMAYKPVFSIVVPIYNTDPEYLLPMIRSVQAQIYPHWQLCLVDDCSPKRYLRSILEYEAALDDRISLRFNDVNQGISVTTNNALQMATGDYIALLDHDDEISVDALYQNAKVINEKPNVGLIYSDEDKMDMKGNRLEPFFKPDYSQDLLETNNYINNNNSSSTPNMKENNSRDGICVGTNACAATLVGCCFRIGGKASSFVFSHVNIIDVWASKVAWVEIGGGGGGGVEPVLCNEERLSPARYQCGRSSLHREGGETTLPSNISNVNKNKNNNRSKNKNKNDNFARDGLYINACAATLLPGRSRASSCGADNKDGHQDGSEEPSARQERSAAAVIAEVDMVAVDGSIAAGRPAGEGQRRRGPEGQGRQRNFWGILRRLYDRLVLCATLVLVLIMKLFESRDADDATHTTGFSAEEEKKTKKKKKKRNSERNMDKIKWKTKERGRPSQAKKKNIQKKKKTSTKTKMDKTKNNGGLIADLLTVIAGCFHVVFIGVVCAVVADLGERCASAVHWLPSGIS